MRNFIICGLLMLFALTFTPMVCAFDGIDPPPVEATIDIQKYEADFMYVYTDVGQDFQEETIIETTSGTAPIAENYTVFEQDHYRWHEDPGNCSSVEADSKTCKNQADVHNKDKISGL